MFNCPTEIKKLSHEILGEVSIPESSVYKEQIGVKMTINLEHEGQKTHRKRVIQQNKNFRKVVQQNECCDLQRSANLLVSITQISH